MGPFLTVLWEDLADPILSGREELGFSKLYAELPDPWEFHGTTRFAASWLGYTFCDMEVSDMEPVPLDAVAVVTLLGRLDLAVAARVRRVDARVARRGALEEGRTLEPARA